MYSDLHSKMEREEIACLKIYQMFAIFCGNNGKRQRNVKGQGWNLTDSWRPSLGNHHMATFSMESWASKQLSTYSTERITKNILVMLQRRDSFYWSSLTKSKDETRWTTPTHPAKRLSEHSPLPLETPLA